jgi:hypothetical protein
MVNRLALAGLAAIFLAGAWLIAAPFVLRYQPSGAPWPASPGSSRPWRAGCVSSTRSCPSPRSKVFIL